MKTRLIVRTAHDLDAFIPALYRVPLRFTEDIGGRQAQATRGRPALELPDAFSCDDPAFRNHHVYFNGNFAYTA